MYIIEYQENLSPFWVGLGQDLADTVYWAETPQQSATCSQALQSVSKKWAREETCGISPLSPVTWRTHP